MAKFNETLDMINSVNDIKNKYNQITTDNPKFAGDDPIITTPMNSNKQTNSLTSQFTTAEPEQFATSTIQQQTSPQSPNKLKDFFSYEKKTITSDQINKKAQDDFEKKVGTEYANFYNKIEDQKSNLMGLGKKAIGVQAAGAISNQAAQEKQIQQQAYANDIVNQAQNYPPNPQISQKAQQDVQAAYTSNFSSFLTGATNTTASVYKNVQKMTKLQVSTALESYSIVSERRQFNKQYELALKEFKLDQDKFNYEKQRDKIEDSHWEKEFKQQQDQFNKEMAQSKSQFDKQYTQNEKRI